MKRSSDADLNPLVHSVPRTLDSAEVRVAVVGFADLYAAALELPLDRLQTDPSWCVEMLACDSFDVEVS